MIDTVEDIAADEPFAPFARWLALAEKSEELAETMMLAGGAQLGLAAGKLKSPLWNLTIPLGLFVGGAAILVHEQNSWL